ncbi:hypothetical protein [Ekhidna sp.]|uniref:hypothetical protein n=1 Tax=Ekhidna sp. TaxID=2608089 RepID=UPI003298E166
MVVLIINFSSKAQEVVREENLGLIGKGQSLLLDTSNPKIAVFDKESINLIPVNPKSEISTYNIKGLNNKNIVGYSISDGSDITFYIEKKNRYIDFQLIRTEKNTQRYGRVNLKLPSNEEVISRFSTMNDFYILTVTKNSSTLNFYCFNAVFLKEKWSLDFSNSNELETSLYEALKSKLDQTGTINSNLLTNDIITINNSLELRKLESINSSKIFINKSNVHITIDSNNSFTSLISISLSEKKYSLKKVSYPGFCISTNQNTNSFIAGNLIFTARYCSDGIALKASSLEGEKLMDWTITSAYESWNNTFLYGDEFLVNTSMSNIISTLSECYAGIIVNKIGNEIMIALGGQKSVESSEIKPGEKTYFEGWLLFPISHDELSPKKQNSQFIYDNYFRYFSEVQSASFQKTFSLGNNLYFSNYDLNNGQFAIIRFD